MSRWVLGDLHGGYRALMQVFERAKFDKEHDELILLGDLVDGWPETRECIDELLTCKNVVFVRGNHDQWFIDYLITGDTPRIWVTQGGQVTLESYRDGVPDSHKDFFYKSFFYHEIGNTVFVHGGLPRDNYSVKTQAMISTDGLMWDRSMIQKAYHGWMVQDIKGEVFQYGDWDRIYVGHTSLTHFNCYVPTFFGNVVGVDTGGGWEGNLSILNLDTNSFFQSNKVWDLYPEARGRFG